MKKIKLLIMLILSCLTIIYMFSKLLNASNNRLINPVPVKLQLEVNNNSNPMERVVISFVVCDSRLEESLNVVKSVLLFTRVLVHFVIFSDDNLLSELNTKLNKWKVLTKSQLSFELHKINFPDSHKQDWLNLFSKCAAQRLFIPTLIPHIDAMIYVDTDTLFLGPAESLWAYFKKFNDTQISAMAYEDDNPNVSWYPRFAKHPFYEKYGLNSGVMLMNLTRMRHFGWVDYVTPIMLKWKLYIPWGDQDIINIIFHYHANAVYVLSCRFNYRSDQCMYGDACADATSRGVFLLHGSRKAFHNDKQPTFKAVYRAIDEYNFKMDSPKILVENMRKYLSQEFVSNCGSITEALLKVPLETLNFSMPYR